jgi:hypothetical protein
MVKDKTLKIRLSTKEYEKLQDYAEAKDISMAQILRDYIRRLPASRKLALDPAHANCMDSESALD